MFLALFVNIQILLCVWSPNTQLGGENSDAVVLGLHRLVFSVGIGLKKACFVAYFLCLPLFCLSLSPNSLQTFHMIAFPLHPLILIHCGVLWAGCRKTSGKHSANLRNPCAFEFVTGPGKVCVVIQHHTLLQIHMVWLLCYSMLKCSHWAQTGKIKCCCTLWVWTEAVIAYSETLVRDYVSCSGYQNFSGLYFRDPQFK